MELLQVLSAATTAAAAIVVGVNLVQVRNNSRDAAHAAQQLKDASAQLRTVGELRNEAEALLAQVKAREAIEHRAGAAVDGTYRALCNEQLRLAGLERGYNRASHPDLKLIQGRREGITAAIRILTDAAGRAGHVTKS